MAHSKSTDSALRQNFLRQLQKLWPAIKGSLSEVRKPCIRPNCAACASGDKHPAFMLSFTDQGRRRCMYVPAELVPQLQVVSDPQGLIGCGRVWRSRAGRGLPQSGLRIIRVVVVVAL